MIKNLNKMLHYKEHQKELNEKKEELRKWLNENVRPLQVMVGDPIVLVIHIFTQMMYFFPGVHFKFIFESIK